VGVGAADVGSGADEVAVDGEVCRVVGAAVGLGGDALVVWLGRDGLLVGAIVRVGAKDLDGSCEAVTDGRAAEPLPAAPQPTRTTSACSASRQTSACRRTECRR
jgi:hypothetical protein